jgi:hypothetical protein
MLNGSHPTPLLLQYIFQKKKKKKACLTVSTIAKNVCAIKLFDSCFGVSEQQCAILYESNHHEYLSS